jgi:DNA-binding transcriptional regulator YhcF (GntR family)
MEIKLQPITTAPIYVQVRDQIEVQIKNGTIASGEQLSSPVKLSKELSVDAGEIQRAYYELEMSGLVVKKKGRDLFGKEKVSYLVK